MHTNDTEKQDQEIRELLRDYPMPDATAGYFDRALVRATHEGSRRQRSRWLLTGFGSAVAAGLALFVASSFFLAVPDLPTANPVNPDATITDPSIQGITMTLEEPRTINLVFASGEKLDAATLTVTLPAGIEMSGFPGQREVRWRTSLKSGRNLLPLKLIATSPMGGEVQATLRHDDRGRTFRLRVDVS